MIKPSAYVREDERARSVRQTDDVWFITTGTFGLPHMWDAVNHDWVIGRLVETERHMIDGKPVYLVPERFRLSFEEMQQVLDQLSSFPTSTYDS